MSTWTFRAGPGRRRPRPVRAAGALALATLLSGCLGTGLAMPAFPGLSGLFGGRELATRAEMADGRLTVTAPPGYCIDPAAPGGSERAEVMLLASCAGLSNGADARHPIWPALLSVTAAPADGSPPPAPADLAAFFGTRAGRAALSDSGDPAAVEVVAAEVTDTGVIVHARAATSNDDGYGRDRWRAVLQRAGMTVSASVAPLAGRDLPADAGRALLAELLAGLSAAAPSGAETGDG